MMADDHMACHVCLGVWHKSSVEARLEAQEARARNAKQSLQASLRSSVFDVQLRHANSLEMRFKSSALLHWRAEASQQRCQSFGLELAQVNDRMRETSAEIISSQRSCDIVRQHMAVNLLAAEQRAEEFVEIGDKLGIVTGSLQGEVHSHHLTLDALEHEVLLLENQITNSGILNWKEKALSAL